MNLGLVQDLETEGEEVEADHVTEGIIRFIFN